MNAEGMGQLRLWCLTIPLPKVPPVLVHAMPIPNNLTADTLLTYSLDIIMGLTARDIKVVSYACDGTEIERGVQRLLTTRAERRLNYEIKNKEGFPDIKLTIPVINGQPIVMVQDSKHALKTYRNNLFSGARLLTLGNFAAMYQSIRDIAFENCSPLYRRDVEKLDRQDDNAAARLFSAHMLQYLIEKHPSLMGEIVYLFVFGELVDAYQNRHIDHAERVKMALRANYFLQLWESYLQQAGYQFDRYCLSREAIDITRIIVNGLLSLIIVYRDYTSEHLPLLPWLHSSEACEHIFGMARLIVKDFTLLDFIHMQPKINAKVRVDVLRSQTSDPKARASGYNHTYFDNTGIDLSSLGFFPSNDEFDRIADQAAQEASSLMALLGLGVDRLLHQGNNSIGPLPRISTWYSEEGVLDGEEHEEDEVKEVDSDDEAQELQTLVQQSETSIESCTQQQQKELSSLTCAYLALTANDMMKAYVASLALGISCYHSSHYSL
jgi:hypothetical protein